MAVSTAERNFNYFTYASDDGTSYNMRGDQTWGNAAASGGTAAGNHPEYGPRSRRRSPRLAVFRDPGSFRTFTGVVYTTAAYAALNVGSSTVTLKLKGAETGVVYTLVKKTPERIPSTVVGRQDGQDSLAT
jgi:hypothetical protein